MKKIIRLVIVIITISAAITGYSQYKKHKNRPEWRLTAVSTGNIREVVTATGTLNPSTLVEVGTEISGKIAKVFKDFNSNVKRGEILAKLDTENLETALESAQADVRKAQLNADDAKIDLDLQKELSKKEMGTAYDLQKAQNKYDQALLNLANSRFSLRKAEKNLQNAIITSPIDGVVVSRNVDEGQTVAASLNAPTLFVLANNLRQMQINAEIDEADIGKIRVGEAVEFRVDAFADEQFRGKVNQVRLSPSTTQNVVTYSVIIDVNNPQLKLLPGMTANVTIVVREKNNVVRIPETALRFRPSKELWKQFGLKWDDNLTAQTGRGGFRGRGEMGQMNPNASNDRAKPDSVKANGKDEKTETATNQRKRPDGFDERPDFSKMTPEQREAFRARMMSDQTRQSSSSNETTSGGQFNFDASSSMRERTRRGIVWVLENGKPKSVEVVTGLSDGNFTEVISGVTEGQELISGVTYKDPKQASANSRSAFTPGGFGPR